MRFLRPSKTSFELTFTSQKLNTCSPWTACCYSFLHNTEKMYTKIPCYMRDQAYRWRIVKNAKIY